MTFSLECMGSDFARSVAMAAQAAGSDRVYSILGACRIEASEDGATIQATNLDHSVWAHMDGKGAGTLYASIDMLRSKAAALTGNKPVTLSAEGDSEATIKQGRTRWTFPLMNRQAMGWPAAMFRPTAGDGHQIEAASFFAPLNIVRHSMTPGLAFSVTHRNGMLIDADGLVVATDGHRLSVVRGGVGRATGSVVFPHRSLAPAEAALRGSDELTFYMDDVSVMLRSEHVTYRTKLLEGQYPDWRRVVATSCAPMTFRTTLDLEAFKAALSRAALIQEDRNLAKQSSSEVVLTFADDECTILARNSIGETGSDACEAIGDAGKFGISSSFLTSALNTFSCDRIALRFGEFGKAGYIRLEPDVEDGPENYRIVALRQIAG